MSYGTQSAPVTADIDNNADDGTNCDAVPTCEGDNIRVGVEIVVGGSGPDNLTGGSGNETLNGAGGNDTLNGDVGNGHTHRRRGNGHCLLRRTRCLRESCRSTMLANDGEAGENDNVNADIENATGGSGADTITGNGGVNRLDGGPGADTLNGGNGNDTLVGPGNDGATDVYNGDGGSRHGVRSRGLPRRWSLLPPAEQTTGLQVTTTMSPRTWRTSSAGQATTI